MSADQMLPDNPENPKFSGTYNTALFRVVAHFTQIEPDIRKLYRAKIGISKDKFEILFGLPNLGGMLPRLIKLFKHEPHPRHQTAILAALSQLMVISRFRNWMVHAGGHGLDSGFDFLVRFNPNEQSAKTGKPYHIFPITAFMDVHKDLQMISAIVEAAGDDDFRLEEYFAHFSFGENTTGYDWLFKLPTIVARDD